MGNKIKGMANPNVNGVNEATGGIQMFFEKLIDFIPLSIAAFIVFSIAFLLARYVRSVINKAIYRTGVEDAQQLATMFGGLAHGVIILIGISVALEIINVDISFIVGSLTFALGFSLKDVLSNYFAGAMILLQKPFHVDDIVKIGDDIGVVKNVTARTTEVRTFDGEMLIIPNNDVFTSRVRDFSRYPERRIEIAVSVAYETDLKLALQLLLSLSETNERLLHFPQPVALVDSFHEGSIGLVLRVWINSKENMWEIKSELISAIQKSFADHKIVIPFPIRSIENRPHVPEAVPLSESELAAAAQSQKATTPSA